MKNSPNFFNWQGNILQWQDYFQWIFIGLAFLTLFLLFITKDLIRNRFSKGGNYLWFKSDTSLWRFVGIVGLAFAFFKTIMFIVTKYPLYWTNLNLHICRIHVMVVFIFMTIGKIEWIKYITYIAIVGTFAGFYYGTEVSEIVNTHASSGKTWEQSIIATPGYERRWIDEIIYKNDFTYFNVGLDNWWLYDFVLAHLSIIFFPIFIRIAYEQKFTSKEIHRMIIIYLVGILLIWSTNAITDEFIDNPKWRMNNWYIGNNKANDYTNTIGWLSGWPQNLFIYSFLGIINIYLMHYFWMWQDKIHFFKKGNKIIFQKSNHWKEYKNNNKFLK